MIAPRRLRLTRVTATWLAIGISVSSALVFAFGYRMLDHWKSTVASLARHQAEESAQLLSRALLRDMRGVQESVLASSGLFEFVFQPRYDVRNDVGSAFARYPYPESLFAWRRGTAEAQMTFLNRGDRRPAWMDDGEDIIRGPVVVDSQPHIAALLLARIRTDVERRRPLSAFEMSIDGTAYQVIAKLFYNDAVRDDLEAIVGFTVNLEWVRQHYFPEITEEVARMAGAPGGVSSLAVRDDQGAQVAGTASSGGDAIRRPFSLLFLDPLLVANDPPADLPVRMWAIEVGVDTDPTLMTAILIANRSLAVAAFATATLTLGLILSVRAARANAELGQIRSDFVSAATHEIKTPIASMRAVGDTIVSGRASGPELVECAHIIVQESKRLTRLVDNLLAYSRITDITEAYAFEPLDIAALVEEVQNGFAWQLRDLHFDVATDIPADLPLIRGDRTALRLAFDNVIDNAIRYSADVRSLKIQVVAADAHVVVDITDGGVGIPADELPHVMRRFFRGRGTKTGGSGLGFTIAQRIVTDHGGTLTLSSEVGRGTTVRFTIPQMT